MKNLVLSLYAVALSLSLAAQSTETVNDANAQVRTVGSFHAIQAQDGIDIYLSHSATPSLAVSANGDYRDKIVTVVENGVLKLYYDGEKLSGWKNRQMRAYIGFTSLDKISASGGADVIVKDEVSANNLALRLSGGSDFSGTVKVGTLDIEQSGGSDVRISGTATNLKVQASGGSDFKGFDLLTSIADLNSSGGSDAEVSVDKEISAHASGGSDVRYRGKATISRTSSSGGSSVSKRG